MKIEYYHASHYGNGAKIAEEFQHQMAAKGITVNLQHVKNTKPKDIPLADLYILSSSGRFGKPIGEMKRFIKEANFPPGSKYALVVTELATKPEIHKQTPNNEELGKCQLVIPFMNEILQKRGFTKILESKIYVTGLKGPLEEGWQAKVVELVTEITQ